MLVTFLFCAIISNSLTISPLGLTYHVAPVGDNIAKYMPRKIGGTEPGDDNHPVTWHPELALTYKSRWMQYSAFYFQDSFDNPAGGLLLGPKVNILGEYFTLGAVGGVYVREDSLQSDLPFTTKIQGVQVIPFGGLTASIAIPITKRFSIETNLIGNPILIHGVVGFKINFP